MDIRFTSQSMSVALGCCTIIDWLAGGNNFVCMAYVRGRIIHELEVVFNALVLCLRGTETLMYSSFIPVENRARSIVFPPEPATT